MADETQSGGRSEFSTFEEYKLFVEDLSRLRDASNTIVSTYVTINSLILAAIAILLSSADVAPELQLTVAGPLLLAGISPHYSGDL